MKGTIIVSFLYDSFRCRTRQVDLHDSPATLDVRLMRVILDESVNARRFGWTVFSHATTVVSEQKGDDSPNLLIFELTGVIDLAVRCRVQLLHVDTSGLPMVELIESALSSMANDFKKEKVRPIGHTVTLV